MGREMPDKNSKNKVTDWRIIGVSGDTVDGRQISADDLKQMAESYDPAVYGARINLEHCYFTFPGWAGGYGDVLELKAEPWHKSDRTGSRRPSERKTHFGRPAGDVCAEYACKYPADYAAG